MIERLLYISESQLSQSEAPSGVADIVTGSVLKNVALDLTGALFFTGIYFAQILEGPSDLLDQVMSSIYRDARHTNIILIERIPIDTRKFPDWGMAYYGPISFVTQHVLDVLHCEEGPERHHATERLVDLAHELSVWRKLDEDAVPNRYVCGRTFS